MKKRQVLRLEHLSYNRKSPLGGGDDNLAYFFTCLWYSCKLQTSNLPKSCLSMRPSTVEVRAAMVNLGSELALPDLPTFSL